LLANGLSFGLLRALGIAATRSGLLVERFVGLVDANQLDQASEETLAEERKRRVRGSEYPIMRTAKCVSSPTAPCRRVYRSRESVSEIPPVFA